MSKSRSRFFTIGLLLLVIIGSFFYITNSILYLNPNSQSTNSSENSSNLANLIEAYRQARTEDEKSKILNQLVDIAESMSSGSSGSCVSVQGDINGDGFVNVNDMLMVINSWGATSGPADINGDGIVNVNDLLIVINNWGPAVSCQTLTVNIVVIGSGQGTVTSNPPGISCGTDCTENFLTGSVVSLAATPGSGLIFSGWSGACAGTGACNVTMNQAQSVTATFNTQTASSYTLTVAKAGSGSGTIVSYPAGISCGFDCTESFPTGTNVMLNPTSVVNSVFTGWSGACNGLNVCHLTMDQTKTVTGSFGPVIPTPTVNQNSKLMNGAQYAHLGFSLASETDTLVVGADNDLGGATNSGAVYVYKKVGTAWNQTQKLQANPGVAYQQFGGSVGISGDTIIVGAPRDSQQGTSAGAAYIFKYNTATSQWEQKQKLVGSDLVAGNFFGTSVSISGNYAFVGAYTHNQVGTGSGVVYVYKYNGTSWVEQQQLAPSAGSTYSYFGYTTSLVGNVGVVGAPYDGGKGAAYVFRNNGTSWVLEEKITAFDGAGSDLFGNSVAVSGNQLLIGAPQVGYPALGIGYGGAVYTYSFNGSNWILQNKIKASNVSVYKYFGNTVAFMGSKAVVGAIGQFQQFGSAYILGFNNNTWQEEKKIMQSDPLSGDKFGSAVSIVNGTAFVGGYSATGIGDRNGAVYLYTLP